ncbi:MAG: FeoB-associated Cys-rich membrane protein [Flammeovirgaceae bacterium]|nr:MAG: FeoB-associated Cys-rich membrane protein [Flammeovirgaceae bacterium]
MLQNIIILLLFLSAVIYLGLLVYRAFQAKSCATGCGKCAAIDVDKIAKELQSRQKF